jgi:DNA-directed RNA polymerase subunit RPC12/RpoP
MSISFQCPRCGKKLKAPDSAAGRASSCPGCGGTVTCPEPGDNDEVVEMQLTPVKPKGFDPFADVDDDKPYGVTAPGPSAEPSDDNPYAAPRPGRAGKPKSGKGRKKAELRSIATSQRWLIICILINILAYIACLVSLRLGSLALALILVLVLLIASVAATVFSFLLTMKISNVGMAVLVLVLSLIPCAGLIALLVINGIATNRLKDAGIHVGFLGADMSTF